MNCAKDGAREYGSTAGFLRDPVERLEHLHACDALYRNRPGRNSLHWQTKLNKAFFVQGGKDSLVSKRCV